jgi:hypothetical protein
MEQTSREKIGQAVKDVTTLSNYYPSEVRLEPDFGPAKDFARNLLLTEPERFYAMHKHLIFLQSMDDSDPTIPLGHTLNRDLIRICDQVQREVAEQAATRDK